MIYVGIKGVESPIFNSLSFVRLVRGEEEESPIFFLGAVTTVFFV